MSPLPSGLPNLVDDGEELARYLTSSSLYNAKGVKPAAFMPNPADGTTSVFRHGAEPRTDLWKIGIDCAVGTRTLYGAAILIAANTRATGLDVMADEPPLRHAVINKWPVHAIDPELEKAMRMEKAAVLASKAILFLKS